MIICREVVSSKYNKQRFEIFWVPGVRILPVPGGGESLRVPGVRILSGTGGSNPSGYRGFESLRELNPLED